MKNQISQNCRQGGFIQGTILFALAILGVIIAAFAMSNSGSSTNTDNERDRVNAGVIIKMGTDLQDMVARAASDNFPPSIMQLSTTTPNNQATIGLYDSAYRYGTKPVPPIPAFAGTTAADFTIATSSASLTGGATSERVVELSGLKVGVCRRVNQQLTGAAFNPTSTIPTVQAGTEGCFEDTGVYKYFRVVAVDVS